MRNFFLLCFLPVALSAVGGSNPLDNELLLNSTEDPLRIVANNRVLASVNGNPITVIDLMKRMDILFLKQFPEYTQSAKARYQFYLANWKRTLGELIDKELILADAKEMKMEVSGGDVRQEMEDMFGPNIILNLDKIGISLDEATKIVSGDILIRRMMYLKVTAKAMGKVTPLAIRNQYDEWAKENTRPAKYRYRMITIREPSTEKAERTAETIYGALNGISYSELAEKFTPFKGSATLSEEFSHTEKEIAPQNLSLLATLEPGALSLPIKQKSRTDKSDVYRLFFLDEKTVGSIPSLKEAEGPIKEQLLDVAIGEEQKQYLQKLRRHYGVTSAQLQEFIPADFVPFTLK